MCVCRVELVMEEEMNLDRKWGLECEGGGVLSLGFGWPLPFRNYALDHSSKGQQSLGTIISLLSALISFSEKLG